jgi:hypothetical protein
MTMPATPSAPGAFLQLIEFHTDRPAEMQAIIDRWLTAIGDFRTARWYITAADQDQANTYFQLVEFPSYRAAMANSNHPATAEFAAAVEQIATQDLIFRNLDITAARLL